ncbi:MAG: hypothetical protein ACK532_12510 [Acidobacteriota bacterium]|nr:hypothetical protein [Betaproteobacteria bacterium]
MKLTSAQLEIRRPVWEALSEMFLDTELQEHDYKFIAKRVLESSLSPKEISVALWSEVFPALASNLQSVAGEWSGFDSEWLAKRIQDCSPSRVGPIGFGLISAGDVREIIKAAWLNVAIHLPEEFASVARAN